jgi:hypothetical protein
LCLSFIHMSIHCIGININESAGWIMWKVYVSLLGHFTKWFYHVTFPSAVPLGSDLFKSSLTLVMVNPFNFNHSNRCVVICHHSSNLHFPCDQYLASFHVPVFHPYFFFDESVPSFSQPLIEMFVYFVLKFKNSILWIQVFFSDIWLATIFPICSLSKDIIGVFQRMEGLNFEEIQFIIF